MAVCHWAQFQTVGGGSESPFAYKFPNGTDVLPQAIDGLCYYPGADAGNIELSAYGNNLPNKISNYGIYIVLGAFFVYTRFRCKTCRRRFEAKGRNWSEEFSNMKSENRQRSAEARAVDTDAAPSFFQKYRVNFILFLFVVMITFDIQIGIAINTLTQSLLPVTSRNGQIIAESILDPIDDIFAFLDDILLVKIGAALIANDFSQMKKVFMLGVFGGAAMGVAGALCVTLLAVVPFMAQAVLNPFSALGHSSLACPLAENDDISASRVYFLMSAWAWPFSFAGSALSGFAMGLGNFDALVVINLISTGLYYVGIVVIFVHDPRLEVLGYVRFAGTALPAILWACYFVGSKSLMIKLGFARQADQDRALLPAGGRGSALQDFWSDPETKLAMRDGVLAMLTELTVELGRTVTLYVAAKTIGIGSFYQISAHQTIQKATGLALAEGALINMKLQGPQLLGAGLHDQFLWLVEFVFVFVLIAALVCALTVYTSVLSFVVGFGDQISGFATNSTCLSDYGGYFGTPSGSLFANPSFETTILSVPVIVFVRVIYRVARSALYAMQDFVFMAQVSLASFVLLFLPAVAIMGFTSQSAFVAVVVMTLPNFVAAIAFNVRLKWHTDRLDGDGGGQHNPVFQRQQTAIRSFGITPPAEGGAPDPSPSPAALRTQTSETELSWGRASHADRITGGASGVMPPPS